jgi:hypothetical protein
MLKIIEQLAKNADSKFEDISNEKTFERQFFFISLFHNIQ